MGELRLIAIGGGGFTHGTDPDLDAFVVRQSGRARPRVGYIGTASHDDPVRIARFSERFAGLAEQLTHLPDGSSRKAASDWLNGLDVLYVGGGNTLHLVETWRTTGLDDLLFQAAHDGVLLAGVSAGAACWFEYALSDSGGAGLAPLRGLGLFRGSLCPHYSSEPQRPPAFQRSVADGSLPDGLAIDDGVAVLVGDNGPRFAVSARAGSSAYRVCRNGNVAVTSVIETRSAR